MYNSVLHYSPFRSCVLTSYGVTKSSYLHQGHSRGGSITIDEVLFGRDELVTVEVVVSPDEVLGGVTAELFWGFTGDLLDEVVYYYLL